MSRTNDLLAEGDWHDLDFESIFRDELNPFDGSDSPFICSMGLLFALR